MASDVLARPTQPESNAGPPVRPSTVATALAVALSAVAWSWVGAAPARSHAAPPTPLRTAFGEAIVIAARVPAAAPALDIAVAGDVAFVAAHGVGVHVIDVASASAPVVEGTLKSAGPALAVDADAHRLAVAAGAGGVQVFARPADGALPTLVGTVPPTPGGKAYSVALDGDVVWMGEWNEDYEHGDPEHGLRAIAPAADGTWREVGALNTPGWAADIAIAGDTAFVADGPGGVRVVNIADPAAPREVGSLGTSVRAYGIDVDAVAMRAYVADNTGGLVIVDVADPAAPTVLSTYPTTGAAYDVAVHGHRAWIAQADGGGPADGGRVTLVDVSRPNAPRQLDEIELPQRAWGISIGDRGWPWVAATGSGVLGLSGTIVDPGPTDTATAGATNTIAPTATSGATRTPDPSATPGAALTGRAVLPWANR